MVTDQQVRHLMKELAKGKPVYRAAAQAGMNEKTGRKYQRLGKLPSQCRVDHTWRTREDPFKGVREEVLAQISESPGLEAKTIFEALQRKYEGRFADGQLRTLQRHLKRWRVLEGPAKEIFFDQEHKPGVLCQSDFTWMNELSVTIAGQPFEHMFFHFVLTYSNWETGMICFSENLESLSSGIQNALHELGGVPRQHRSDRMSAAVNNHCEPEAFTQKYQALLDHYGLEGQKIQAGKANENGDVEQRHHRFKRAVEQELLLRGSREFFSREQYECFLQDLMRRLNAGRKSRFEEECRLLRALPQRRLDDCRRVEATVARSSTVRVLRNTYSVHSRLIGEKVQARVYAAHIEIWHGQQKVDGFPRQIGRCHFRINYRHMIDWLVRKPGAFENYRYRDELFPSSIFRTTCDLFKQQHAPSGVKNYLRVLQLAAQDGEERVEGVLRQLFKVEQPLSFEVIEHLVKSGQAPEPATKVEIAPVDLAAYDTLIPMTVGLESQRLEPQRLEPQQEVAHV